MAFTGDCEDVNSLALSAVSGLLEAYDISPNMVGRLEVGTETLVDKSKSTKTVLMQLFSPSRNSSSSSSSSGGSSGANSGANSGASSGGGGGGGVDMEGATIVNACYGGTAALLNALEWVESEHWDGRFALVVAVDVAAYSQGPARPTGGCGACAVLVGRDAPLAVDLGMRASFAAHEHDFYKPNMTSEFPVVRIERLRCDDDDDPVLWFVVGRLVGRFLSSSFSLPPSPSLVVIGESGTQDSPRKV
jgi:hydroxymethylglutaryl-CoA synthase